jgi:hypothetical protein
MLTKLKSYLKLMLNRFPLVGSHLQEVDLQRKFSVELDLIKGRHHNQNQHPSIIHFSLNKAATQYTGKILEQCAVENGMVPVNIHGYPFNTNFPYLDHRQISKCICYKVRGEVKARNYRVFKYEILANAIKFRLQIR